MFLFLKYIQPIWYYRQSHRSSAPLLLDVEKAAADITKVIKLDSLYQHASSRRMDFAYQALVAGVIPTFSNCIPSSDINEVKDVNDNYVFIRKYFATHWYFYAFLLRLITLNNPFHEAFCFIRNYNVRRIQCFRNIPASESGDTLKKLSDQPLVSIVIPTLNRYTYLRDVLSDLEKQDYVNFEVLVCDQSVFFQEDFYLGWKLNIKVFRQLEKALWLARNTCIKHASGVFVALTEDDVRLPINWLTNHLRCIQTFNVDISCGIFYKYGSRPSARQSNFRLGDFFATGNSLIKKTVFQNVGLFDRQFERGRMGDGEFGLRCVLHGYSLVQNPAAFCEDVKASVGGLRDFGSWDSIRVKGVFSPSPVPSVLYFVRRYFDDSTAVFYILNSVPFSFVPYKYKNSFLYKCIVLLLFPFIMPFLIINALKSWSLANRKLNEGPFIDKMF